MTAWRALIDHAALSLSETALIHGGSGGVGHVAVQLAAAAGAEVIATARPDTHERLSDLGADHTLDYRRDDLAEAVIDRARPDVILDHRRSWKRLAPDRAPLGFAAGRDRVVGRSASTEPRRLRRAPAARGKDLFGWC
ncbi:MAG: zinc-binding dehydrogenase [Halodesulfurarchaeum sp.]|nr:zinc-binding dehydrogenase [Halodesulfurarchaeum sp.]